MFSNKTRIIVGMLSRNEEGRWLRQVCAILKDIADYFIILDDASTDNTTNICKEYANKVKNSIENMWETNEVILRKQLFNLCMEQSSNENDWIMIIDADELFYNYHNLRNIMLDCPKYYDAIGFKLYDMWTNTHYRNDSYWNAHTKFWPMAFRSEKLDFYQWNNSPLHCGRFPVNIGKQLLMSTTKIKHMGWSTPEDRKRKYDRYMRIDKNGEYGILEQYLSILDENPRLVKFND